MMDRRQHLVPLANLAYIYLNTLWQFAANGFRYDPWGMPTLFTHRISPQSLWPITDVVLICGLWMPTNTFLCLYWDNNCWEVYRKCLLLIDYRLRVGARSGAPEVTQNGKGNERKGSVSNHLKTIFSSVLSSQECVQIAAYHRVMKRALPLTAAAIYAFICAFCMGSFFRHWSGSLVHDFIMLPVTGLFLFHATVSNCMLMGLFCVTTRFVARHSPATDAGERGQFFAAAD